MFNKKLSSLRSPPWRCFLVLCEIHSLELSKLNFRYQLQLLEIDSFISQLIEVEINSNTVNIQIIT